MARKGFEQRRMTLAKAPKDHTHIALCLMYSGLGFRGLQVQTHGPTHHTVEGVLIQAMKDAGVIPDIERGRPKSNLHHFSRSCRTDRGVHAIRNVVALFVRNEDFASCGGVEGIQAKLNDILLPAIRVAKVSVVMGNFIPRNCCNRRVYRYLIPVYALIPPCDSWSALEKSHPHWRSTVDHMLEKAKPSTHWDLASMSDLGDCDSAWVHTLKESIDKCNALLSKYYCGSNRFHNFSVDAPTPGFSTSKVIRPDSDDAARMIYRCEIAPRVFLLPTTGEGVTLAECHDNMKRAPPPEGAAVRVGAAQDGFTLPDALPYVIFQVEGGSFLFNMIRKMVGAMLSVCRGANESMLETALSPERRVTTPLAPGPYLYLATSTYHGYDTAVRRLDSKKIFPLQDEWSAAVATESEEFAFGVIARDIVDMDANRLPPLDDILAARDRVRRVTRPQWESEDSHLADMKEYKPAVAGRAFKSACCEMTVFLRLLRVHNWCVRTISLPENCKAMLEVKNKKARLEREAAEAVETASPVASGDADAGAQEGSSSPVAVPDGGADGWIYVAPTVEGERLLRHAYFSRRWKRSRPWEYSTEAGDTAELRGAPEDADASDDAVSACGSE